jgi:hypothetical protein
MKERSIERCSQSRAGLALKADQSFDTLQAARAAGLPELCERLVKRAQRSGQLRRDLTWEDIPMIACGLGRITQATVGPASRRWPRFVEIILDGLRAPGSGRLPRCP